MMKDFVLQLAAAVPGWKRVLATARRHEVVLTRHFDSAFAEGSELLPDEHDTHQEVEQKLDHAISVVDHAMRDGLPKLLHAALVDGGNVAGSNLYYQSQQRVAQQASVDDDVSIHRARVRTLGAKVPKNYGIKKGSVEAANWARAHAGTLVDGITKATREQIRTIVGDALDGDLTWPQAMKKLDKIFDDEARAKVIGRTEAMRSVNEGQKVLWTQAVNDGYLDGDEQQVWITTPDDRTCAICDPMNGEQVALGEDFDEDGPPAHPNCRCTVGLIT